MNAGAVAATGLAGCALALTTACTPAPATVAPDAAPDAAASSTGDALRPSRGGEGTIRKIARREDVPLTGLRVDARPGDWLLENAGKAAVVDARGRIVDFGEDGHDDALVAIEPEIYVSFDDLHAEVVAVGPSSDAPGVLRIERRVPDAGVRLTTFVAFAGPALRIESIATAEGGTTGAITVGEKVGWGNVPTWVQGTGFVTFGGTFAGDFIAREGLGQAYALAREDGRIGARFNAPGAGFHERAHTGENTLVLTPGARSPARVLLLAHAAGTVGDAVTALLKARQVVLTEVTLPAAAAERAVAEVASCPGAGHPEGLPFAGFPLGLTPRAIALPPGCFRVRATAPGYAPGTWTPADAPSPAAFALHAGRLRWHVTDPGGATLPARLVVHGVAPTADPNWGEEPHDGAALEAIATLGDGEIPIPPGRYRITITRGFEYTAREVTSDVAEGRTATVSAVLDRVVDTRGWISADLHVHAVPSPDAPTLLDDRVRSLAASGVEVAAATDHNAVTDYGPTIRALGAGHWLTSIVGDEITTRGIELGHFNVFPLVAGETAVLFEARTPHDIFAAARAAAPGDRDKVVQVNHPRMGTIGYFDLLHLDRDDLDRWRRQSPLFEAGFDALEVFNGDDYAEIFKVETCLRDWYALLDAGLRVTATGNSDSHKMTYHEPGVPRNFVRVGADAPDAFDERGFIDAVRRGRVVVSSGPFVRLTAAGAEVGDETPAGDAVEVRVHVEAPPWVDVDTVQLVRRGEVVATWHPKGDATGPVRLDETTHLTLHPGDWLVAVARGTKPMTFLHRGGAVPFGFTNPIYVR